MSPKEIERPAIKSHVVGSRGLRLRRHLRAIYMADGQDYGLDGATGTHNPGTCRPAD